MYKPTSAFIVQFLGERLGLAKTLQSLSRFTEIGQSTAHVTENIEALLQLVPAVR
jgi:hypothetical protein